jgi:hypothetical protein
MEVFIEILQKIATDTNFAGSININQLFKYKIFIRNECSYFYKPLKNFINSIVFLLLHDRKDIVDIEINDITNIGLIHSKINEYIENNSCPIDLYTDLSENICEYLEENMYVKLYIKQEHKIDKSGLEIHSYDDEKYNEFEIHSYSDDGRSSYKHLDKPLYYTFNECGNDGNKTLVYYPWALWAVGEDEYENLSIQDKNTKEIIYLKDINEDLLYKFYTGQIQMFSNYNTYYVILLSYLYNYLTRPDNDIKIALKD